MLTKLFEHNYSFEHNFFKKQVWRLYRSNNEWHGYFIVSETRLDESFHVGQFVFEDFEVPFGVDQNYNDRVIISIVREDIPSKLHSIVSSVAFFLEDKSKKIEMVTQLFFQST